VSVDRSRLPVPAPPPPFDFPPVEKSEIAGGMRVWTIRHDSVPVVTFVLLIARGSAADPPSMPGLAALTADMLDEGSAGRSAIEMHETIARMGAQFDTDIGADAVALTLTTLSRFADRALMLLADMAVRPSLSEADFERVRQLRAHRLAQLRDVPAAVAERTFLHLIYGDHPYGHGTSGTEQALGTMSVDDVRGFHGASLKPSDTTLIVAGDCRHDEIERYAAAAFDGWSGIAPPISSDAAISAKPARLNIVARPGAQQSELRIGHVAAARSTPDYHAIVAMNMVLGGQFVSRINMNLRQEKGFTYGARTGFDFRRMPGPFALQASVGTKVTGAAIAETLKEFDAIRGSRPATPQELELGVAALTRGYARNFETAEQIARAVAQIALYGLPDDYFAQFVPAIERVTAAEATRVAAEYIRPERLTTLIVGDVDVVKPQLEPLGLGEPAIVHDV